MNKIVKEITDRYWGNNNNNPGRVEFVYWIAVYLWGTSLDKAYVKLKYPGVNIDETVLSWNITYILKDVTSTYGEDAVLNAIREELSDG